MSWQPYVDSQLVATGHIHQACILSSTDASVWAATADFCPRGYEAPVTNEAGEDINEAINEAANIVSFIATGAKPRQGLRLNGDKYMVLRTIPDPLTIYGKKPKGGCCITKTGMCVIIGTYNEDMGQTSGGCNIAVEALGDYLRQNGC